VRLCLQDLDWTTGSVLIRAGKTSRERVLPLPEHAGAALARYLYEARPVSTERAVFLSCGPGHPPKRGNGFMAKLVDGGWVYTGRHSGSKMEIPAYIVYSGPHARLRLKPASPIIAGSGPQRRIA